MESVRVEICETTKQAAERKGYLESIGFQMVLCVETEALTVDGRNVGGTEDPVTDKSPVWTLVATK